jgi:hypothetical protein
MEMNDRRSFLLRVGQMGLFGSLLVPLTGCPPPAAEGEGEGEGEAYVIPPLPWPYAELDLEQVRKSGHLWYGSKECCGGVFTAIVKALASVVGDPYDKIPCDMMLYGAGGVAGMGSLCGTLNGAGAAMSLVFDKPTVKTLMQQVISWYGATALPSDESDGYAVNHQLLEGDPYTIDISLPASVSGSELCHVSVTEWCLASSFTGGSPERKERCGRLAGDVAAKAVELMNAMYNGTFAPAYPLPSESSSCAVCHKETNTFDAGGFTRGSTDCNICHKDAYTDVPNNPLHNAVMQ